MKQLLKIFTLVLVLGLGVQAQAQDYKYGYVNSQELISLMPQAESANTALEKYQAELAAAFEKKVKKFQDDIAAFEQKYQTMAPAQAQEVQAGLQKRQQELAAEEQSLTQQLNVKRNELLEPILIKIDDAIKAVGKEGGYTMIFDSGGMNVMLYLDEALNVLPQVKAKLGL